MRIRDLELMDVCRGRNWRVVDPETLVEPEQPLEETEICPQESFAQDDFVVYPCVYVTDSGVVSAMVLLKRVGDYDYGGSYCEFVAGGWRQLGLVPNPDAEFGEDFVAAPLENDPSFDSPDGGLRAYHAKAFREWSPRLVA